MSDIDKPIGYGRDIFLLVMAVLVLLVLFAVVAATQGDYVVSGKGDDGYFWASVFYPDYSGIEYLYPNIAFLRLFQNIGFELLPLYLLNLVLQIALLVILLRQLRNLCGVNKAELWIFLWVATSVEILFVTVFFMRDLYILLCILLIAGTSRANWIKMLVLTCLALLRPFGLIVSGLLFPIKKVLIAGGVIIAILFSVTSIDELIKFILMPNAVIAGQNFEIEDVVSARSERVSEGKSKLSVNTLSTPIFAPLLMIVRPLVPNKLHDTYVAHNGLTGVVQYRNNFDPYVLWQNLIIPVNCIYLANLFISLFRGLIKNQGGQRGNVIIYLFATTIIAIISGQGRHHLMISWLEPVIMSKTYKNSDIRIAKYLTTSLILFSLMMAFFTINA
ncbi:MAG: hypothetical protein CO175_08225 [Verrucomicrobia bacterium CG_4_9_14_3_um_filter_43_20]|nr:hypothetical protein [Bacteroidota bacterium]PJA43413.1 MAG: hypothetical protein CO175_08225 [Verrucomicrobia bacterium CG_4_9_14_3_um_filter_43_20]